MHKKKIDRINELYRKSKAAGLTDEEKVEQQQLRKEYVQAFRGNLERTLEQVSIVEPDGSVVEVKNLKKSGDKTN